MLKNDVHADLKVRPFCLTRFVAGEVAYVLFNNYVSPVKFVGFVRCDPITLQIQFLNHSNGVKTLLVNKNGEVVSNDGVLQYSNLYFVGKYLDNFIDIPMRLLNPDYPGYVMLKNKENKNYPMIPSNMDSHELVKNVSWAIIPSELDSCKDSPILGEKMVEVKITDKMNGVNYPDANFGIYGQAIEFTHNNNEDSLVW